MSDRRSLYCHYVYVATSPLGWSKIGIARDPAKRLRTLRLSVALGRETTIWRKWKRSGDSHLIEQLALGAINGRPSRQEEYRITPEAAVRAVQQAFKAKAQAMKMIENGKTVPEVAAYFHVAKGTIYNHLKGTVTALRDKGKRKRKPSK